MEFLKLSSHINQLCSNMNEKEYQLKQTRSVMFVLVICLRHVSIVLTLY